MKVNVNGGHTKYAKGAVGHLDEYVEDRKIVARLIPELKRRGCTVSDSSSEERTVNGDLAYQVRVANASGAELAVSVHLNAGGGTGTECYYFGGDSTGYRVAADMSRNVANALGLKNRGAKDGSHLYWVKNTNMTAVLLEVCFVDSAADASAYHACSWDSLIGAIADAIVAAPAPKPPAWKDPGKEYAGADRYETSRIIAEASHPDTPFTVKAKGSDFPDALTALWIAGSLGARFEYEEGPLSIEVSGADRYATNRALAKLAGIPQGDTVIVVPGEGFADGIVAGSYSYAHKVPIRLYQDGQAFRDSIKGFENVIVVGDTVPKFDGETERIGGADRAAVAVAWAEAKCKSWELVNVCSGSVFTDGVAAAQMVGDSPLLFAGWGATIDAFKRHKGEIKHIVWFGGTASIPTDQRKAICEAAGIE